jgi:hypothetical protein
MPTGKAAIVVGQPVFLDPLPHTINVSSLRRLAKRGTPALTVGELRANRKTLRTAFEMYRRACAPQLTLTERRRELSKIKVAAGRLAEAPQTEFKRGTFTGQRPWANRLLDELNAADINTRVILQRYLSRRGHNWSVLRKTLMRVATSLPLEARAEDSKCGAVEAASDYLATVQDIADLDIDDLVPRKARLPDPALATLVTMLAPMWCRVTGRTAALISANRVGDAKKCPFAEWVNETLKQIGLPAPPVGRVVGVVRPRRKLKKHAPVTGG